jgi:hypothetical protein
MAKKEVRKKKTSLFTNGKHLWVFPPLAFRVTNTGILDRPYMIVRTAINESWKETENREGGLTTRITIAATASD